MSGGGCPPGTRSELGHSPPNVVHGIKIFATALESNSSVEYGVDRAIAHRKCDSQLESILGAEADSQRLLLLPIAGNIPCSAGVVEDQDALVGILDGSVNR